MNTAELIAAKKAQRAASGLAFRITFDGRPDFNYYASNKADFDAQYAKAVASVGVVDKRHNMTALSVEVLR